MPVVVCPLTGAFIPSIEGICPAENSPVVNQKSFERDVPARVHARARTKPTLVDMSLRDTLPPLSVTEKTDGNGNVLARERALLVFVCEVPYFCKHGWG